MTALPEHWVEHRREDGEVVGWIDMHSAAPDLVPIDRLGRPLPTVDDWLVAEECLEERGLGFLMGWFSYQGHRVRIRDVDDRRIVVTTAVSDAVGDVGTEFVLDFPVGPELTEATGR